MCIYIYIYISGPPADTPTSYTTPGLKMSGRGISANVVRELRSASNGLSIYRCRGLRDTDKSAHAYKHVGASALFVTTAGTETLNGTMLGVILC